MTDFNLIKQNRISSKRRMALVLGMVMVLAASMPQVSAKEALHQGAMDNVSALEDDVQADGQSAIDLSGWDGKKAESYAGGTGTKEDPYQIASAEQLAFLRNMVNAGEPYENTYFVLTADINLSKKKWVAIGKAKSPFKGHLDGKEHTITNFVIKNKKNNQGIFGYVLDGSVVNVKITSGTVKAGNNVGLLIGTAKNARVSGCTVSGVVEGTKQVAGVVGRMLGDTGKNAFLDCVNKAKVIGDTNVGGAVGFYKGVVEDSKNYGDVFGVRHVGGIAGRAVATGCLNHGTIGGAQDVAGIVGKGYAVKDFSDNLNLGSVQGSVEVGGIVGYIPRSVKVKKCANYGAISGMERVGGLCGIGSFENSHNRGIITGEYCVGGLVGYTYGAACSYGYNRGKVKGGSNGEAIGGIIGYMDAVSGDNYLSDCYNTGKVTGKKQVGGVVGYNGGNVSNTFFRLYAADTGIGAGEAGSARPRAKADMRTPSFLELLNNGSTKWEQKDGQYPILIQQKKASGSNLRTAKSLEKVELFTAVAEGADITFTWDAYMRITGYELQQYDTEKKKFVRVAMFPSTTLKNGDNYFTNEYVMKGLKADTSYQFRIRVYKYVGGTKYTSEFTTIKVKTK